MTDMYYKNPVIREAQIRGDYAYFAYQLRYFRVKKWKRSDVKKALPIIDRWAAETCNNTPLTILY